MNQMYELVYMLHTEPQENDCNRNAAQANHRDDIKLNCTHIQDSV